jgi:hypothetical protein
MGKAIEGTFWINGVKVRKPVFLQNRKCEECGSEFEPKRMDSKYCSRKCGKKAESKRHIEWVKAYHKERYRANKDIMSAQRKARYWKDPERWRQKTKEYRKNNPEKVHKTDMEQHNLRRFSGLRDKVLEMTECCSMCGSKENLVVHHQDKSKDNNVVLNLSVLCRGCHLTIHNPLSFRWGNKEKKT